jgi:drug/metabolite transporter (DMT)-like permease
MVGACGMASLGAALWIVFTVSAAGAQTLRNAVQRELTATLGTVGATHVRFLYGLPFGIVFCAFVLLLSGAAPPLPSRTMLFWCAMGAASQIIATALLLAAMREKSFVVVTALSKTEPVHVALFGLAVLGDTVSGQLALAIALATAGVLIMSWPKDKTDLAVRPVMLGLVSASFFALSAIGFRRAILELDGVHFMINASTTLVIGLTMQVTLLTGYLLLADRATLVALLRAWRPSIKAGFMGAFASLMWFSAFAIQSAAMVRTLALIEIVFAQLISRTMFRQSLASRETLGVVLITLGVILLLNA